MVCNATLTHGVVPQHSDSLGQLAAHPAAGLHRLSIGTWVLLSLNMMTPSDTQVVLQKIGDERLQQSGGGGTK